MEILINKLVFAQEPHTNSLIAWIINKKRYKKECFLMDINRKIWSNIARYF